MDSDKNVCPDVEEMHSYVKQVEHLKDVDDNIINQIEEKVEEINSEHVAIKVLLSNIPKPNNYIDIVKDAHPDFEKVVSSVIRIAGADVEAKIKSFELLTETHYKNQVNIVAKERNDLMKRFKKIDELLINNKIESFVEKIL